MFGSVLLKVLCLFGPCLPSLFMAADPSICPTPAGTVCYGGPGNPLIRNGFQGFTRAGWVGLGQQEPSYYEPQPPHGYVQQKSFKD